MKRLHNLTTDELAAIDELLRHQPIEPVLRLWEDLRECGDMPAAMRLEHVRAMAWALYRAARDAAEQ